MQRSMAFWIVFVLGLAAVIVGVLLSAAPGYSGVEDSSPAVVGAPILIVIGIIAMFFSAVVWELYPGRDD